jgi:hypothetical protein
MAERGDQRIGDNLNHGDARAEHEQREQEHAEARLPRGRNEQQAARRHRHEAERRGPHIARFPDDRGGGDRE